MSALSLFTLLLSCAPSAQDSHVLRLTPAADNTLYQTTDGSLSNGSGERLFAGVTASGFIRRGLVRFDLAAIPEWAIVTGVSLRLEISKAPVLPPPVKLGVYRLTASWGEGASDAPGEEGAGAPSQPGDATWLHRIYPTDFWSQQGGDYDPTPSATAMPGSGLGPVEWSTHGLVRDVQGWVSSPASNHGWLIRDREEVTPLTAKRFDSREFSGPRSHLPILTVHYQGGAAPCAEGLECPSNLASVSISSCRCVDTSSAVTMSGGPAGEPACLLVGQGSGTIGGPGSKLCLGGAPVWRYGQDAGAIDAQGRFSVDVFQALSGGGGSDLPLGAGSLCLPPGQTYGFQFWYRQAGGSAYSQAVRVTFQ